MPSGNAHDLLADLAVAFAPIRRHQVESRHRVQFTALIAEQIDHIVVDIHDATILLGDEHRIGRTLQSHAQALFAFAHRLDHAARHFLRLLQQLLVPVLQIFQFICVLARHALVEQAGQQAATEPEQRGQRHHDGQYI